jgi:hypothetical protein
MQARISSEYIAVARSKRVLCKHLSGAVAFLCASMLMLKMGLNLLAHGWIAAIGWMLIFFSVLMLPLLCYVLIYVTRKLRSNEEEIVISEQGLLLNEYDENLIKWDTIASIQLTKMQLTQEVETTSLTLRLRPFFREVTVVISDLTRKPEDIASQIQLAMHGGKPWDDLVLHKQEKISLVNRISYSVTSAFLLVYGAWTILKGDLYVVSRRGDGHIFGAAAYLIGAAMLFCGITLLIEVIDHYDKRTNEFWYDKLSCSANIAAGFLCGAGLLYL